jgi:hypothetical protein
LSFVCVWGEGEWVRGRKVVENDPEDRMPKERRGQWNEGLKRGGWNWGWRARAVLEEKNHKFRLEHGGS